MFAFILGDGGLVAKVVSDSCDPMDWRAPGESVRGISLL